MAENKVTPLGLTAGFHQPPLVICMQQYSLQGFRKLVTLSTALYTRTDNRTFLETILCNPHPLEDRGRYFKITIPHVIIPLEKCVLIESVPCVRNICKPHSSYNVGTYKEMAQNSCPKIRFIHSECSDRFILLSVDQISLPKIKTLGRSYPRGQTGASYFVRRAWRESTSALNPNTSSDQVLVHAFIVYSFTPSLRHGLLLVPTFRARKPFEPCVGRRAISRA